MRVCKSIVFFSLQEKGSRSTTGKEDAKKSSGKDKKKSKEKNTMSLEEFNKSDSHARSKHNSGTNVFQAYLFFVES